jgi:ribosomal protein L7/L12
MTETAAGFAFALLGFFLLVILINQVSQLQKRVTSLSRVEAKVDLLLRHAGIAQHDPYANLPTPVIEAIQRGEKIQAIKLYREASGATLKDAKDFIEEVQRRTGHGA